MLQTLYSRRLVPPVVCRVLVSLFLVYRICSASTVDSLAVLFRSSSSAAIVIVTIKWSLCGRHTQTVADRFDYLYFRQLVTKHGRHILLQYVCSFLRRSVTVVRAAPPLDWTVYILRSCYRKHGSGWRGERRRIAVGRRFDRFSDGRQKDVAQ